MKFRIYEQEWTWKLISITFLDMSNLTVKNVKNSLNNCKACIQHLNTVY